MTELVTAAMAGGSDAYEEFVIPPLDGGSEATLTLWLTLPDSLDELRWRLRRRVPAGKSKRGAPHEGGARGRAGA